MSQLLLEPKKERDQQRKRNERARTSKERKERKKRKETNPHPSNFFHHPNITLNRNLSKNNLPPPPPLLPLLQAHQPRLPTLTQPLRRRQPRQCSRFPQHRRRAESFLGSHIPRSRNWSSTETADSTRSCFGGRKLSNQHPFDAFEGGFARSVE